MGWIFAPVFFTSRVSKALTFHLTKQLEEEYADTTTETEEDEELSVNEEEEEKSSNGDPDQVSTVTRAKQLAEGLKIKLLKMLQDLGRIMVVILLGLAGKVCSSKFGFQVTSQFLR